MSIHSDKKLEIFIESISPFSKRLNTPECIQLTYNVPSMLELYQTELGKKWREEQNS